MVRRPVVGLDVDEDRERISDAYRDFGQRMGRLLVGGIVRNSSQIFKIVTIVGQDGDSVSVDALDVL